MVHRDISYVYLIKVIIEIRTTNYSDSGTHIKYLRFIINSNQLGGLIYQYKNTKHIVVTLYYVEVNLNLSIPL